MKRIFIILVLLLAGVAGAQEVVRCDELKIYPSVSNTGSIGTIKPIGTYYIGSSKTYHVEYENLAGDMMIAVVPDSGGMSYHFPMSKDYRNHQITAGVLEDWVKHCYDDSTAKIVGRGGCKTLLTYPSRIVWDYYDTIYVHKDPNDNIGLLAWIKNKMEVK